MPRDLCPQSYCYQCLEDIACDSNEPDAWPYWSYTSSLVRRGVEWHSFAPCCEGCSRMELLVLDARTENRRFSEIMMGMRCDCGRALSCTLWYKTHGPCVPCRREFRMLTQTRRAIKQAAMMCRELKRTALERERQAA